MAVVIVAVYVEATKDRVVEVVLARGVLVVVVVGDEALVKKGKAEEGWWSWKRMMANEGMRRSRRRKNIGEVE